MAKYFAHSRNNAGHEDPLPLHLQAVSKLACEYAGAWGSSDEGRAAGLLHDLGKYGELFQRRLRGAECRIDHWSAGAWAALQHYRKAGVAAALSIQGHHLGLLKASKDSLADLDLRKLALGHPLGLRLSEPSAAVGTLLDRLREDGLTPPSMTSSAYDFDDAQLHPAAGMLDVRMLFSALVDADFLATEAHFNGQAGDGRTPRPAGVPLQAEEGLRVLLDHIRRLANESTSSPHVNALRADLLAAALDAAEAPPGLFTLTAPTGSGKTLSLLAFALKHAAVHGLRRVVTVIPYLSIIEQTVREYRGVFESRWSKEAVARYILEHHSLAGTREAPGEHLGEVAGSDADERLLAENWDAPIIVTTSVQLLESLFANRPSACRKLHSLAGSILLFDEVQTLPARLVVPTLAALAHLSRRYRATVVFGTATQPAFAHLDPHVRGLCMEGWAPAEVAHPRLSLFLRARRTKVRWPEPGSTTAWPDLAERLRSQGQALCIVNLKRHAVELYEELLQHDTPGLLHVSTSMCPAHRVAVLALARERLANGQACILVSTQCVEAGVDVDFPVVYRAFGPLDSIAQAAGRCNRNGRASVGEVHVFHPSEEGYPGGEYEQAAMVTQALLDELGPERLDIHDPEVYEKYYRTLYAIASPELQNRPLLEALRTQDFGAAARNYRIVAAAGINVLVPYESERFAALAGEVRQTGLTRRWVAKARAHAVTLFRPKDDAPVQAFLDTIRVGRSGISDEWFIYLRPEDYDNSVGLRPPQSTGLLSI